MPRRIENNIPGSENPDDWTRNEEGVLEFKQDIVKQQEGALVGRAKGNELKAIQESEERNEQRIQQAKRELDDLYEGKVGNARASGRKGVEREGDTYEEELSLLKRFISEKTMDAGIIDRFSRGQEQGDFKQLFDYMNSSKRGEALFRERFEIQSDVSMMESLNAEAQKRGEKRPFSVKQMVQIIIRNHLERMEARKENEDKH